MFLFSDLSKVCNLCSCGIYNRNELEEDVSLEKCKQRCNLKYSCSGIEYWTGGSCYECLDPDTISPYQGDSRGTSSVFRKQGILQLTR